MNINRILTSISILLLVILFMSCARISDTLEKPAQPPLAVETKTQQDIQPPQEKLPEVNPPEVTVPKVEPPLCKPLVGKADRYTVGCVLPLSGAYAAEG